MRSTPPAEISLCSLVKAELLQLARQSAHVEENLELLERFFGPVGSLPFDDRCAEEYGLIQSQIGEQANAPAPADLMLAAMAAAAATVALPQATAAVCDCCEELLHGR